MKEKLFNQLKAAGKIPEGLLIDNFTEEQLLSMTNNSSFNGNATQLNLDDFKKSIFEDFENKIKSLGIDKIDAKYMKLPNAEIPENELVGKSPEQIKKLKMLKFINNIYNSGGSYQITPGNTLALNTEGTTTTGGFTVPVEFLAEVSRLLNEYGICRRDMSGLTMSSMTATMPKLNAAPAGAFVSETAAKTESNPTFTQITFTRHDYAYITGLSRQLLQDTGVDLVGLLAELAANDFAMTEDTQGILGTGSPITGAFSSITDSAYIVTTSGQAATTLTYANLVSVVTKPKTAAMRNAKWYFNKALLGVIFGILDSQNRPIFIPEVVLATKQILGFPYELTDVMTSTITASSANKIILFGDMKKAATFASRENFNIAMSDTATVGGNSAFEKNLMFYRFEESYDIEYTQPTAMAKIVTLT